MLGGRERHITFIVLSAIIICNVLETTEQRTVFVVPVDNILQNSSGIDRQIKVVGLEVELDYTAIRQLVLYRG